jgi:hypothetical protein
MHLPGTVRRVLAVVIALQAGFLTTVLGAGGADATAGCAAVTGHLVDNSTSVTAVFHVPTTCAEVSVLSWMAPDAKGGDPQHLVARKSADNVAAGDYEWTIAAPPAECFRQLDLRVPGRNVDSIVGGEKRCSSSSPPPPTPKPPPPPPPGPVSRPEVPCTHWSVTAKSHEIIAGRYVQHLTLNATCVVTVVSFKATGPNWPNNGPQVLFDRWRGTLGPGAHTESVALPSCFFQADLAFFQADLVVKHRVLDTATGGTGPCATTSPRAPSPAVSPPATTPPSTTTTTQATAPTTAPLTAPLAAPTTAPPRSTPSAVAPLSIAAPITPTAVGPSTVAPPSQPSTTPTSTPVAVLGLVITPPNGAAVPLPKTGGQQEGLAGVGLLGIVVGFGLLTAGRQRRRSQAQRLPR